MSALVALAALAAQLADVGRHREFQNWVSVCDNGLRCQVSSAFGQAESIDVHMHLEREAGSSSSVKVGFSSPSAWERGPHSVVIDGRVFPLAEKGEGLMVEPGSSMAVARALGRARDIYVVNGRKHVAISANGSAAALRDMDARQRRAATVTAIVATGHLPASSVPPPPALPIRIEKRSPRTGLIIRPSAARLGAWRTEGCHEEPSGAADPPTSWPIDGRTAVVVFMCSSGSHNPAMLVKVGTKADGSDARAALFDHDASMSEQRGPDVPPENPSRDETTRRLVSGTNGGIAYPSSWEEWIWDGNSFRLVTASSSYGSTFRAHVEQ